MCVCVCVCVCLYFYVFTPSSSVYIVCVLAFPVSLCVRIFLQLCNMYESVSVFVCARVYVCVCGQVRASVRAHVCVRVCVRGVCVYVYAM